MLPFFISSEILPFPRLREKQIIGLFILLFLIFPPSVPNASQGAELSPITVPRIFKGGFDLNGPNEKVQYEAKQGYLFSNAKEYGLEVTKISLLTIAVFPDLHKRIKNIVQKRISEYSEGCHSLTPAVTHSVGDPVFSVLDGSMVIKVGILSDTWICSANFPSGYSQGAKLLPGVWSTLVMTITAQVNENSKLALKVSSKIIGDKPGSLVPALLAIAGNPLLGVIADKWIQDTYRATLDDISINLPNYIIEAFDSKKVLGPRKGPYPFRLAKPPRFTSVCWSSPFSGFNDSVKELGYEKSLSLFAAMDCLPGITKRKDGPDIEQIGLEVTSETTMPAALAYDYHEDLPKRLSKIQYREVETMYGSCTGILTGMIVEDYSGQPRLSPVELGQAMGLSCYKIVETIRQ